MISYCFSGDNIWARKIPNLKYRIRGGFPQHLIVIVASFLSGSPLRGVTPHMLIRVCVIRKWASAGKQEKVPFTKRLLEWLFRLSYQSRHKQVEWLSGLQLDGFFTKKLMLTLCFESF